jgi:NAD(P)H-dependent FMN reductase
MLSLKIIACSTRPGRNGIHVARWFEQRAKQHGGFAVEFVDLQELELPLLDEPQHPRFKKYEKDHTKKWSAIVDSADAFAFVTPEYDYTLPAVLLNALQCLALEWARKVCCIVSYGGVSGGTRSAQAVRGVSCALNMMALPQAVSIPFFNQHLKEGAFDPGDTQDAAAKTMLDELGKWAGALKPLRSA